MKKKKRYLNKQFMKVYLRKKDKEEVRKVTIALMFIFAIFNYCVLALYKRYMYDEITINYSFSKYLIIVAVYNIWALIIYIFPEKLEFLFDLYKGISFFVSSILNLILSINIFLDKLDETSGYLIVVLSIIIYLGVVVGIILNIRHKMLRGFGKLKLDKKVISCMCSAGVAFGIIISKKIQENEVFDGLCMFLASLMFLFGVTGIHVFYLKIKGRKNIKK